MKRKISASPATSISSKEQTIALIKLMNLELLKADYPPCVITVENRLAYYEVLDQWMAYAKTEAFIQLV